ncbi:helix-turn-helix domain-containing protein [Arthrobacter gengyunqii]|uniref:Helix-turn-helix domain-containing protein n=1 Tax=Arthrobacter gengyunqii TaxID=2886940 RepID=A0A9X1S5N5_9MICC|nr:helix-turn-helix transcriptional regulator [Arthrobacter gengyunqii]MCC3268256.1 helix-turn-helix domain-containing protein [Arthrobacter gengyunqii]UOY95663.1 helix-turn-helix domain-containing protein [Arthrobacter gengyunqii]
MDLDDLLGIKTDDPVQRLARELLREDDDLLADLVQIRRETMTQQEVADRLQISRPSVAAFERYDSDPRLSAIRRYALAIRAHVRHTVYKPEDRQDVVFEMVERTRPGADERSRHDAATPNMGAFHRTVRAQFGRPSFVALR